MFSEKYSRKNILEREFEIVFFTSLIFTKYLFIFKYLMRNNGEAYKVK